MKKSLQKIKCGVKEGVKLQDLPLAPNLIAWDYKKAGFTLEDVERDRGILITTMLSPCKKKRARILYKINTQETTSTLRTA